MFRDNPRLRASSGKQDGRYFNNRGGERGRQPISFQSCTGGERAAMTVVRGEDESHGDQAEGGQKQNKVDQTQTRVVHPQDDPASQRREDVGKL